MSRAAIVSACKHQRTTVRYEAPQYFDASTAVDYFFDNIDSVNFDNPRSDYPEYIDLMCKASTGGKIPIAELYKTNVQKM
jgi:hypothetical protein